MSSEDKQSFRVTTVTSETVIINFPLPPPSYSGTVTIYGPNDPLITTTLTTEIVLTIPVTAIPTALASVSPHSSTPGPSKTPILIAVATIIPLLAALAIALAIFRCRRHLTRARAPSVTTSQVHLEAQDSEFLGEKQSMRGHWSRVVPDVATSYPKSHTECPQATPPSDILGPELGDAPNFGSNNDVVEIVAQPDSDAAAVVVRPRRYGVITPFVKRYQSISSSAVAATPAMVSVGTSCPASVGPSIIHGRPTDGTAQDGPGIDSGGAYEVMNDDSSGIADSIAPPPYSQID